MYEVWCSRCQGPHFASSHDNQSTPVSGSWSMPGSNVVGLRPGSTVWIQEQPDIVKELTGITTGRSPKSLIKQAKIKGGLKEVKKWKRASVSSKFGDLVTIIPETEESDSSSSTHRYRSSIASNFRVLNIADCYPGNDSTEADLTALHHTHEAAILHNLKERALSKQPYTFVGELLISVNPRQNIDDWDVNILVDPHPHTIAEKAIRKMKFGIKEQRRQSQEHMKRKTKSTLGRKGRGNSKNREKIYSDQAIIISGESGAGKTEASRRVLSYLVDNAEFDENIEDLNEKILRTEPILEAFGNASTTKNPNSSRFGKFVKIYFSLNSGDYLRLCGGEIQTYLLEKSRVTSIKSANMKERNYHVFYNILAAPYEAMRIDLGLNIANDSFRYLGGKYTPSDKDQRGLFELTAALNDANLPISFQEVYSLISGVMHLGNISFSRETTAEGDVAKITERSSDYSPLAWAATLIGVTKESLSDIICKRTVRVGKEEMVKRLDIDLACKVRDSVAKTLYSLLFDWIVQQLNSNLTVKRKSKMASINSISILDIFGFEVFEKNGFEQLLINYANEILQKFFIEQVLVAESELLRREGILIQSGDIPQISASSTHADDCIHLLYCVFSILENSMRVPSPSETKFIHEVQKKLKLKPCFVPAHRKEASSVFIVEHYASSVTYTVGDFLEKNDDSLPEISNFFGSSSNPVVSQLSFLSDTSEMISGTGSGKFSRKKRRKNTVKTTLTAKFREQMVSLNSALNDCGCSYIRCIKPNPVLRPPPEASTSTGRDMDTAYVSTLFQHYGQKNVEKIIQMRKYYRSDKPHKQRSHKPYFEIEYVSRQLRSLGIFDAVNVLKSGLPTRVDYATFVSTFLEFIPKEALRFHNRAGSNKDKTFTAAILWAFQVVKTSYRLGNTKVFFKFGQLGFISNMLYSGKRWANQPRSYERQVVIKRFNAYFIRILWRRSIVKVIAQNHFLKALKRRRAAVLIQGAIRDYFKKMDLLYKMQLDYRATEFQRIWRGYYARKHYVILKSRNVRASVKKRIVLNKVKSSALLQTKKLDKNLKISRPDLKNLQKLVGGQDVATLSSKTPPKEQNPILEGEDNEAVRPTREDVRMGELDISQNVVPHKDAQDISNMNNVNNRIGKERLWVENKREMQTNGNNEEPDEERRPRQEFSQNEMQHHDASVESNMKIVSHRMRNERLWVKNRKERTTMHRRSYKSEAGGKRRSLPVFPVAKHEHQTREELTRDFKRFMNVLQRKLMCKMGTQGEVWTSRKVTLRKYNVLPGKLSIFYKTKSRKTKVWVEITMDHTVMIEMKELTSGTSNQFSEQLNKHIITLTEVKTGRTVQFYFSNVYDSTAFYYELRRSQQGFFGNDVLDETTRELLGKIDEELMNGKVEIDEVFKAFHYRKNSNPNPLFDKPKSKFQDWMRMFHSSRRTAPMVDI